MSALQNLAILSGLLLGSVAHAKEPAHVDAMVGTNVAVNIGAQIRIEGPYRIRGSLGLGFLPGGYLNIINSISTGFGWYDELTADLIAAALKNSLIFHPRIGWRPIPKAGFHFDGGWMIAALGGSLTGAETVAVLTGEELADTPENAIAEIGVNATDHMLTVDVGYEVVVKERLVMDFTLGGAFSVVATSKLEGVTSDSNRPGPGQQLVSGVSEELTAAGEQYLNETFTKYVHTPTVGIMVGYRFR